MADVQGLDELMAKLSGLESLVTQKNIIVRALRAGAEPIKERASQLAPDDATTPGSRIRDNMMTTVSEQTATGAIAKIGPSRKGWVGSLQEFGTIHHSAQPFLRPAFDEMQGEAVRIIGETLKEEIEAVAR